MQQRRLIPIGQFSQASGLSVKALRLYAAVGPLRPARVDASTGYRYYHPDQLGQAQLIRMLRQLGVPVGRLGELLERLDAGEDITATLHEQVAYAERQLADRRALLDQIQHRISTEGETMSFPVRITSFAAMSFLAQRHTVGRADIDQTARDGFADLYAVAGHGPLTLSGNGFIRYHGRLDEDNQVDIELCLPFAAEGAQPVDLPEHVYVIDLPEVQFAHTTLTGDATVHPAVLDGYDAVASWIVAHGFTLDGPAYEIFRRWTGVTGHPDNTLDVGWPIESA